MAFNAGNYIKSTAKSVGERILVDVIDRATNGMPQHLNQAARSVAESLFNTGASFESISAFTSQRTDSLVNGGSNFFYAIANKDPARVAAADIKNRRRSNIDDIQTYLSEINPATKIKAKRRDDSVILNGVI